MSLAAEYTANINGVNQTVNLLVPGQAYADRINQVDMRLTKILRLGRTRTSVGVDVLNLFNSNTAVDFIETLTGPNDNYLQPNQILNPRFVRFNITVNY